MELHLVQNEIKKCQVIYYHPDYYLFSGDGFGACSKYSGEVVTYPKIKTALHSLSELPNNRLLIHDAKSIYHIVDLEAGVVLASKQMPKQVMSTRRFAISSDGNKAFRIWLRGNKYCLAIINLHDLGYQVYPYKETLNYVADLISISNDELLVLETEVSDNGLCRNLVTSVTVNGEGCTIVPLDQWEGNYCGNFLDGNFVLDNGYNVRNLSTGDTFSLLENSDILLPKKYVALSNTYYPREKYLQLIDNNQNIFIDCKKRKIVARYQMGSRKPAYAGILTGNEFRFGKADGIYSSPFPLIEEE